eukprot:550483-Amphidinium_carterae.1
MRILAIGPSEPCSTPAALPSGQPTPTEHSTATQFCSSDNALQPTQQFQATLGAASCSRAVLGFLL